ncbi:Bug family tripartite tricarboxylate transporter substrate binding protein [Teichococcus oryzae]|uniref:Tripartite tricarboxylate transporter substrate binding protein n=1 Tax=Teichococcus oryzae TaxID=1608942 RepID=A0A5B2TH26_9PROT|nr:tripartite tricarboxylate transporter substrate binding protein [Pseudoroseomonas oryzae]KAA2213393.1 tripartite tricarboxylate transporter substrate binding protein [Pseudoroseomonas oryzae]
MIRRRGLLGAAALAASPLPLRAQGNTQGNWPDRPVRLIVPYPPGGSTDVIARLYAERLGTLLGQPVVVENRPGASGNIGTDTVAKAAPDGSTLGVANVSGLAINPFLFDSMPFDPARDLVTLGMVYEMPNVAVVAAGRSPARTLAEFIAWARERPQGITYGSTGIGQTTHLSSALLFGRTKVEATHVPYRGASQTIPALLAGDVDFTLDNLASYIPLIKEGRIRALAVTSAARWPTLPDVPTMAEAGLLDFVVTVWGTLIAPAGTPPAVVQRVNAALRQIAADPAFQQRLLDGGALALSSTPEEAVARIDRERPMWRDLVRTSGAKAG